MSLREKIAEKGSDLIDKKGAEGIDSLLDQGRDLLGDEAFGLGDDEKEAGGKVLDLIAANKTPFLRLGQLGFANVLAYWEDEDEAAARRHYLEFEATFDERNAAIEDAGDSLVDKEDAEEAAWAEVVVVLKAAGKLGLDFLIKLAIRALGLPI